LTPKNAPRGLNFYAPRVLLGLIALLMAGDFVVRGLGDAFDPGKTDFSDVYTGAWLWRHGQDFYDSALATRAHEQLIHASVQIAPVYPPTAFVLVSPLTYLPWGWANLIWLSLGLVGIPVTLLLLLRLRGSGGEDLRGQNLRAWDLRTIALATVFLSFNPLHQAVHLGNSALFVVPLCLGAILLAEGGKDVSAGLLLGFAGCLKPQLAFWICVYYLCRLRGKMLLAAVMPGLALTAIYLRHAVALPTVIAGYRANVRYWFAPGRPDGFTEGARPYHVNMMQVVLYQMVHSVAASNLVAYVLFLAGVAVWFRFLWRARFRLPVPLAISSLLALSFLALYHSVSDVTLLLLALCWALPSEGQPWTRARVWTCVIFLLLMLPGHSVLMRYSPRLDISITARWWWHLFVERYFVWLLLALNIAVLGGLQESTRSFRERATTA